MGVNDNEGNTGNRKRSKPTESAGSRWAATVADAGGVGWDTADYVLVKRLTVLATRQKMAVSLAATADNRGVSITILDGSERPKWYANTTEELNARLEYLIGVLSPTP